MKTSKAFEIRSLRGFTLVELLTVVTIIVILSALTVGAMGWVQKKAAVEKTRAQMALIENGLERYYSTAGVHPEVRDFNGLVCYKVLFGDGVGPDGILNTDDDTTPDGKPDPGATVYVAELDPRTNSMKMVEPSGANAKPTKMVDAFGSPFRYAGGRYARQNPDFDLYSSGPDGKFNTDDDINNW